MKRINLQPGQIIHLKQQTGEIEQKNIYFKISGKNISESDFRNLDGLKGSTSTLRKSNKNRRELIKITNSEDALGKKFSIDFYTNKYLKGEPIHSVKAIINKNTNEKDDFRFLPTPNPNNNPTVNPSESLNPDGTRNNGTIRLPIIIDSNTRPNLVSIKLKREGEQELLELTYDGTLNDYYSPSLFTEFRVRPGATQFFSQDRVSTDQGKPTGQRWDPSRGHVLYLELEDGKDYIESNYVHIKQDTSLREIDPDSTVRPTTSEQGEKDVFIGLINDQLINRNTDNQTSHERIFEIKKESNEPSWISLGGGGWNAHTLLSGIFAGLLDKGSADNAASSDVANLMHGIDGISGNSGGSWFLSHLGYSEQYLEQLDSKAKRDLYTDESGWIGSLRSLVEEMEESIDAQSRALLQSYIDNDGEVGFSDELNQSIGDVIDLGNEDNISTEQMDEVTKKISESIIETYLPHCPITTTTLQVIDWIAGVFDASIADKLTTELNDNLWYLKFASKGLNYLASKSQAEEDYERFDFLTWSNVVENIVNEPLGLGEELKTKELSDRLPWLEGKYTTHAVATATEGGMLNAAQGLGRDKNIRSGFVANTKEPIIQPDIYPGSIQTSATGDSLFTTGHQISSLMSSYYLEQGKQDYEGFFSRTRRVIPNPVAINTGVSVADTMTASGSFLGGFAVNPPFNANPSRFQNLTLATELLAIEILDRLFSTGSREEWGDIYDAIDLGLGNFGALCGTLEGAVMGGIEGSELGIKGFIAGLLIGGLEGGYKGYKAGNKEESKDIIDKTTSYLKGVAPLFGFQYKNKKWELAKLPSETEFYKDSRSSSAVEWRRLANQRAQRFIDGGYADNTSVTNAVRQIQDTYGSQNGFRLSIISTGHKGSFEDKVSMPFSVSGGRTVRGASKIHEDVADLFGVSKDSLQSPPDTVTNSDLPTLTKPTTTIFKQSSWYNEVPIWEYDNSGIEIDLYKINTQTIANKNYGIKGGQPATIYLINATNNESAMAPADLHEVDEFIQNYSVPREGISNSSNNTLLDAFNFFEEANLVSI